MRVRLTPKSSLDAIDGIEATADGPAFKARVRAAPSEGEANAALAKLLARWLDVPKSSVSLSGGGRSRVKSFTVTGEAKILEARLNERAERFHNRQKS